MRTASVADAPLSIPLLLTIVRFEPSLFSISAFQFVSFFLLDTVLHTCYPRASLGEPVFFDRPLAVAR
jgi:hypothetical protein